MFIGVAWQLLTENQLRIAARKPGGDLVAWEFNLGDSAVDDLTSTPERGGSLCG
jgi:hypothetical protein